MEGDNRNPRMSLLKKYDIPIDHLSFEYVETCKDKKELERIARILRSGEEGTYPDLIKTVENKLRQIAPDSRVLRFEAPVLRREYFSNEEWKDIEDDLQLWQNEMRVLDGGLNREKKRLDAIGCNNLPEIRKAIEPNPNKMVNKDIGVKKIKVETKKPERIKSGDYAAWEKFDVDKELLKLDLEDEREEEKNSKMKREMEKEAKQVEEKKIEPLNIDPDSYSDVEQQILASQAKDRGNECYKSGDYEQALKYYKVSLKLFPNAATYNNRAMTYIKMRNYEEALKDCNEVLKREKNNIKALHRRATSYQNLPGENNDELALKDLTQIVTLEPSNRVAQNDLQILKQKLNIQDIGKKFRMMIEESGNDELAEFLSASTNTQFNSYSDDDDTVDIRKLPLTYYGPSTSTFQCEPHSITHRMLSDPNFSGQILCKCNSNATRQNPLCHICGERLSRPKKKAKKPKTDVAVDEKNPENRVSEVKIENKLEPFVNGENEKSKVETDGIKETSSERNFYDSHENDNEIKSELNNILNITSEEQNNNEVEAISKADVEEEPALNKEDNEGIQNTVNEFGNEEYFEKGYAFNEAISEELNAEIMKADDMNGNILSFYESGLQNATEAANNNDECKELEQVTVDNQDLGDDKGQSNTSDNSEQTQRTTNETADNGEITENDSNCLPSTSNQVELVPEGKKSRSKKKKSREPRPDGVPFLCTEPVKIVQAPKYLNPTSSEPKLESEKPKEDNMSECKSQFKSFVPSKKRSGAEGGVLTINTSSFAANQRDNESRMSPQIYSSADIKMNYEGNKENILENGNDQSNFKMLYSGEDTIPVGSSFEFMKSWESMKKCDESYEKRAQIIQRLRPEDLKTVIGNNLDSEMLKSLLECLEKHFLDNDPKKVTSILKELPRIPRFSLINLFLNPSEREVLQRLIEKTEKKGYFLDEEVKKSLRTSF